jgi:hypothetical protein
MDKFITETPSSQQKHDQQKQLHTQAKDQQQQQQQHHGPVGQSSLTIRASSTPHAVNHTRFSLQQLPALLAVATAARAEQYAPAAAAAGAGAAHKHPAHSWNDSPLSSGPRRQVSRIPEGGPTSPQAIAVVSLGCHSAIGAGPAALSCEIAGDGFINGFAAAASLSSLYPDAFYPVDQVRGGAEWMRAHDDV